MSEVAAQYSQASSLGVPIPGNVLPKYSAARAFSTAGDLADVPLSAGVFYSVEISNVGSIKVGYLHVRQSVGSIISIEARVLGSIIDNAWFESVSGETLAVFSQAKTVDGEVIASKLLFTAVVSNVTWTGSELKVFADGAPISRAPISSAISNILFRGIGSNGRRTLRCPVVWDIQAGDTVTHLSMSDFFVSTMSITIQQNYKVLDLTERV